MCQESKTADRNERILASSVRSQLMMTSLTIDLKKKNDERVIGDEEEKEGEGKKRRKRGEENL